MKKTSLVFLLALTTTVFVLPPQARAETDFSKFSLCKAAPADAFITVAARQNPDREFLNVYWSGVTKAFWDSGIVTDLWDLVTDEVPDESLAQVEEIKERFTELCGKVGWDELFEKEMIYTARFASVGPGAPPMYEGMVIGRLKDEETASKNFEALHSILTELSKFIEAKAGSPVLMVTTESRKNGLTVAKASFAPAPFLEINVGTRKDVIIISFGTQKIFADAVANLSGDKEVERLVDTPRFSKAFSKLPSAEDTIVFFDVERMMSTFRGYMGTLEKMGEQPATAPAAGVPNDAAIVGKIVGKLLRDASIVDYMATVEWTDGHRVLSETRTTLRDGGASSPLYDVLGGDKSVKDFAKYLPREATSFDVTTGLNIAALYDYVSDFVENNVPEGKQTIAQWKDFQKNQIKLDVRNDILGLVEGTCYSVALNKDSVKMMRVTDEKKANAQIQRLLDFVKANVPPEQGLSFVPVKVGPESELYQISHPMLMMQGFTPVFGCTDGYFIVASNANCVKTVLQTGRGKHANITESTPWKEQALVPDEPVTNISFTNQSRRAEELQEQISAISVAIGFMQIGAGNMPPEAQKLITAAARIVPKLLPVAEKMNFFKSKAAYTVFKDGAWTTRSVQNYKSPAEVKKLQEAANGL